MGDVKEKLKRVIAAEAPRCVGLEGGKLSRDRAELKARYLGESYGADAARRKQGWSTYVDRTVMETVEWCKPGLFRIFCSGDEIVRFEPRGPEDEDNARDATDYVNQVVFGKNAFELAHHVLTDGLMQRVGWAKAWYDVHEEDMVEQYAGLSEEEAVALVAAGGDGSVDVAARPMDEDEPEGPQAYDVTVRRKKTVRQIRVDPIPSENVIVARDARNMETCRFVAHWEHRMVSDLIREGYPKSLVEELPKESSDSDALWPEKLASAGVNGAELQEAGGPAADESTRLVKVHEAYLFCDVNGDGKAERVKVVYAGDADKAVVMDWEEWPMDRPPLFPACSVPLPHSVVGLSMADLVLDIQRLKSELTRYYLDNLYSANQGEVVIRRRPGARVDFDQFLARRPGGVYEIEDGAEVMPLPVQSIGTEALAGLDMADKARETRTGIGQQMQGVQADELQNTATGAAIMEERVNQRLELVARVFAETFFKPLARYVLRLLSRYGDKPGMARLKGRFIPLDPRKWDPDMDVTVSVGLGTGNRMKMVQGLGQVMTVQERIAQTLGAASPVRLPHVIEAAHRMSEALGFENPERFFGTKQEAEAADAKLRGQAGQIPAKPDPEAAKLAAQQANQQARLAMEARALQAKLALEQARVQAQTERDRLRLAADIALRRQELAAKHPATATATRAGA